MRSFFFDSQGHFIWVTAAIIAFAFAFSVVGILRIVEFSGLGLTTPVRALMTSAHIVGCLLFSAALTITAVDFRQEYKTVMNVLFFCGVALLVPGQIVVALKRRALQIREQQRNQQFDSLHK